MPWSGFFIDFQFPYMDNPPEHLTRVIRDICAIEHTEDGLSFDPQSVEARTIKEGADYEGVRISFRALLGKARLAMQVDVGFNDAVYPGAVNANYPTLLDLPAPSLRIYAQETVVAEKAQAMVHLGNLNSRLKDFYDMWRMSRQFDFNGRMLSEAIRQTFDRRDTEMIEFTELASELRANENTNKQWQAFLQKSQVDGPESFSQVLIQIEIFLSPVFSSVSTNEELEQSWSARGPWRKT